MLTKTDFVNAFICPTKLNYIQQPEKYTDSSEEDEYLQSLSDGGYQVGKLAQLQFEEGIEASYKNEDALVETSNLINQEQATIFEAAIEHGNFFIRVDIVRKDNDRIDLIEVKAKSYDSSLFEDDNFYNQNGSIKAEWQEYFYDLAFQYYVVKTKYPNKKIRCFFHLPNKNITSKVDNLFNKFSIKGKKAFFLGSKEDLADNLIYEAEVTKKVQEIVNSTFEFNHQEVLFSDIANELAQAKVSAYQYPPFIGSYCKDCKFRDKDKQKSGMHECWKQLKRFTDEKFNSEKVIDIWNIRSTKKLLEQDKFFIDDLEPFDLKIEKEPNLSNKSFSNKDRQYFQCFGIDTFKNNEGYIFNHHFLKPEIDKWRYPLNFIDFETATLAIPPYKGLSPYEMVAFQYSIHTMNENGEIKHSSQFLSTSAKEFPNFEFIKQLVKDLSSNEGSIFMWYPHEQRTIEAIKKQILKLKLTEKYKDELEFVDRLLPMGDRELIDLYALAKNGTFYPNSKGSVSIKKVLPAVFQHSKFIQDKYSKSIYGKNNTINSLNFEVVTWVQKNNIGFKDPYEIISEIDSESINQGGMASTTFAKLQFSDLNDIERDNLQNALLRYCELDTFAMVVIAESWLNQ